MEGPPLSMIFPNLAKRVLVRSWILVPWVIGIGWVDESAAHPRYSIRAQRDCRDCHTAPQGGPLTAFGRLWESQNTTREPFSEASEPVPLALWSGESVTWFRSGRERVLGRKETQTTVSESLVLRGDQLFGNENLSFQGEAFGRANFASTEGYDEDRADLLRATLTYRNPESGTVLKAGRHWVTAGVGAHWLDGVSVHRRFESVELDGFAGVPVDNAIGGIRGDLLAGGRVGVRHDRKFQAGVSAFTGMDDDDPFDVKYGLDFLFSPSRQFDISGHVFYDWISDEFYDSRIHFLYKPNLFWQFAIDYTRTIPGAFLPKNSIFSVFSVDDYEEASFLISHRWSERVTIRVYDRYTDYEDGSDVHRLGADIDIRFGPRGENSMGLEVAYHDEERKRNAATDSDGDALFLRVYHLLYWTEDVYSAVDAFVNAYSGRPFSRNSALGRLTLGWQPADPWDLQVGTEYHRSAEFVRRWDVFARLTYRF